jgi:hypothetical protein
MQLKRVFSTQEEIVFREKREKEFEYYLKKLKETKVKGENLYHSLKKMDCDKDKILREIGCDDHFMKVTSSQKFKMRGTKGDFLMR